MPIVSKNKHIMYSRQRAENIRVIISEIKVRRHMTDAGVAKAINMPLSTFYHRKAHPGEFRLEEIWQMYQALEVPEEQRGTVV